MDEFEKRFDSIMAHHITVEIGRAEKNIDDAIRPYVTFVQLEKNRILETRSSVEKVKREINDIKAQVV